jgi:hypothetical protein
VMTLGIDESVVTGKQQDQVYMTAGQRLPCHIKPGTRSTRSLGQSGSKMNLSKLPNIAGSHICVSFLYPLYPSILTGIKMDSFASVFRSIFPSCSFATA